MFVHSDRKILHEISETFYCRRGQHCSGIRFGIKTNDATNDGVDLFQEHSALVSVSLDVLLSMARLGAPRLAVQLNMGAHLRRL